MDEHSEEAQTEESKQKAEETRSLQAEYKPETLFFAKLFLVLLVASGIYVYYSGGYDYVRGQFVTNEQKNTNRIPFAEPNVPMWEEINILDDRYVVASGTLYYSTDVEKSGIQNVGTKEEFNSFSRRYKKMKDRGDYSWHLFQYISEVDVESLGFDEEFGLFKDKNTIFCAQGILKGSPDSLYRVGDFILSDEGVFGGFKNDCTERNIVTDVLSFQHATGSFYFDKNRVYEHIDGYKDSLIVIEADPVSFKVLGYGFLRDKDNLFFNGESLAIENSDPETFQIVEIEDGAYGSGYFKDKNNVYYVTYGRSNSQYSYIVEGANPDTFETKVLSQFFSVGKDLVNVYVGGTVADGVDPSSLETFDFSPRLFMDKDYVYLDGKKQVYIDRATFVLEEVDENTEPESLGIIRSHEIVASDKNNRYIIKNTIDYGQTTTIEVPEETRYVPDTNTYVKFPYNSNHYGTNEFAYSKDANRVYCNGLTLLDADADSFEPIVFDGNEYTGSRSRQVTEFAKDKNDVFHGCERIPNSDPGTFKIFYVSLTETHGAHGALVKDKNNVYTAHYFYGVKVVDSINAETYEQIGVDLFKNTDGVYCGTHKIEDADPVSFVIIHEQPQYGSSNFILGKDDKSVFYSCEPLQNVDFETFTFIGAPEGAAALYAKDKQNIYWVRDNSPSSETSIDVVNSPPDYIIEEADVETFEVVTGVEGVDAQDKDTLYQWGRVKNKRN